MKKADTGIIKKMIAEKGGRKVYLPNIVYRNPLFAKAWLELLDSKGLAVYATIDTYWNADGGGLEYVDSASGVYNIGSGVFLAYLFDDLEYGEYEQYASLYVAEKGIL